VVKANGVSEKGHLADGEFKVITNFHLEDLESGNYTCYRHDLARSRLEDHFENTIDEFEGLLHSVHQEYPGATVYSNIFDLTAASSTLYYNAVFDEKIYIDFRGSRPENPVLLEDGLFKKRMAEDLITAYKKGGAARAADYFTTEKNRGDQSAYQIDVQQLIDLSEYLYRQDELRDYEYILDFAGKTFPQDERFLLSLGKSCLRKGNIDKALEAFEKALERDPENYWAGRLLREYSDPKECTLAFTLKGYENATSVLLYGNFNEWRGYDNVCRRIDGAWTTCVTSGERVLQYRFKVDGEWVEDPENPSSEKRPSGLKVSVKSLY
jgi:tetratricopeptide (TPR) repeat protein